MEECYGLRQRVLWPQKPIEHVKVAGDESALHLRAFIGPDLIGCGSFFDQGARVQLRKLAVLEQHQGQGVGRAIVKYGAQNVGEKGAQVLWCDARETAIAFYERLGFVIAPERFDKTGVI